MSRKCVILALIASAIATSANAAHLSDVEGAVFVNNKPVNVSMELVQGDRVKVDKGAATLVYADGSALKIKPGHTLVVLERNVEQGSLKDVGYLPPADPEAALVVAGGVGLAIGLTELSRPTSP
jgi:hypothetical protein